MECFNIFVGIATIVGLVLTFCSIKKEKNKNNLKRERTKIIVKENISKNIDYINTAFGKFNQNFEKYKETTENDKSSEYQHRIDLVSYFINSYGNESFINNIKNIKNNIDSYFINNVDNSNFNHGEYIKLNAELNDTIKEMEYYKYQIDIFIEPYDDFLKRNLNEKIIYNNYSNSNYSIPNDLVTNRFNNNDVDNIITPIQYYSKIIRDYDKYFNNLDELPVPLMNASDGVGTYVKSLVNIDFENTHKKINNIINRIKKLL